MPSTLAALILASVAHAAQDRIATLNAAFVEHVRSLPAEHSQAAAFVERAWKERPVGEAADGFVPDALGVLYPGFREVLTAFDDGRFADAARLAEPLRQSSDPFLVATAQYYHARSLIEQGLLEEAEPLLREATEPAARLAERTPYAPHIWYLRGFCEASNLRFDAALQTLAAVSADFPNAPEAVLVGARQLRLEVERREIGTLDEVATLMTYASARLKVADATQRVRERQDDALKKLDKLIEETEQQEQSQSSGGSRGGQKNAQGQQGRDNPSRPRETSEAPPSGPDANMDLHRAPKASPGEMWGKLPPAEREKILQSLRERFPSRYRQLVEQYYRSLAEGETPRP